jgi:hypothetical protein
MSSDFIEDTDDRFLRQRHDFKLGDAGQRLGVAEDVVELPLAINEVEASDVVVAR